MNYRIKLLKNELPICSHNLLNDKSYYFEKWARRPFNNSMQLLYKTKLPKSCKLMQYSVDRVVACFDVLCSQQTSRHQNSSTNKCNGSSGLHFVFIGDSRIRQQFFYFLKMVPDYDRITKPTEIPKNVVSFHHGDVEVLSRVMKLRVSYKWRPILNDTVIETLRYWSIKKESVPPDFIVLSMEVHHMLESNGANFKLYRKKLNELGPILDELAKSSKVIWLNQYPTIDFYGGTDAHNTFIHSEKIHQYNEAVRQIFKKHRNIQIWDSSNSLAQEYVRGCTVFHNREIPKDVFVKGGSNSFINCKSYINCDDYIHTGYVALSQATLLLYNDICNFNSYVKYAEQKLI